MAASSRGRRRGDGGGWGGAPETRSPGPAAAGKGVGGDACAAKIVETSLALSRLVSSVLKPGAERLGTAKDTRSRRRMLARAHDSCAAQASHLDALLVDLRKLPRAGADAALRSKSERDGRRALKSFQDADQAYQTALRAAGEPREDAASESGGGGGGADYDGGAGFGGARAADGEQAMVELTDVKVVASGRTRVAYELALERREEMKEISREIGEVEQLGRDLADGVDAQSERVDAVVENVTTALEAVKSGNESIRKAADAQRAARRKMCCIAVIVVVILAAILGPTIAGVTGAF